MAAYRSGRFDRYCGFGVEQLFVSMVEWKWPILMLVLFRYTKKSNSDDSLVHLLELGYLRMTNLLPNEIYKEVICPTEIQFEMPIEHKVSLFLSTLE